MENSNRVGSKKNKCEKAQNRRGKTNRGKYGFPIDKIIPLALIGICFFISLTDTQAVAAAPAAYQDGDCLSILREAAASIGVQGEEEDIVEYWNPETGELLCTTTFDKTVDERGPVMGEGYFYYENTQLYMTNMNDDILSTIGGPEDLFDRSEVTFHGYPALYTKDAGCISAFEWYVPDSHMQFSINRCNYEIKVGETNSQNIEFDIRAMAEVFYAVAYNRMPELGMNAPEEGIEEDLGEMPIGMEEGAVEQPEGGNAGNMVMPVTGALLGTLAAFAVSNASALGTMFGGSKPKTMVTEAGEELYWSERPWDEAGPGYVTKAEYEQTQQMMEQGYRWTKDGWQQAEQMDENARMAEANRKAVEEEDTAWREEWEREHEMLEENGPQLKEKGKQLDAAMKMNELKIRMYDLHYKLKGENYYVQNPYQEDLVPIRYGLSVLKNIVWDKTAGLYTGSKGIRCEDYVDKTLPDIKEAVQEIYGSEAEVVPYKFDEKSSIMPRSGWNLGALQDWCDSWRTDNHILVEVKLPDKTELSVDFHQKNLNKRSEIVQPMSKDRKHWKGIIGEGDFYEGITGI